MSLRAIGGKLIKHGVAIIRHTNKSKYTSIPQRRTISNSVKPLQQPLNPSQKSDLIKNNRYYALRNLGIQISQRARRLLVEDVLNGVSTKVFQKTSHKGLYGNTAPLLSLVGCAVIGQGLLTKDEELEGVCCEIRECMSKIQWNRDIASQETTFEDSPMNLQAFTFGKPIAKGSNAVVYSVKHASQDKNPLALKMMFNYDIQSNSLAILKAMYRETVPAPVYFNCHGISNFEYEFLNMTRHLPPHPNIVKILSVFTDFIPELEQCHELYPAALPKRIDPEGEGRNMSLFILMNEYQQNLQEFLNASTKPSLRTSVLILTQLLEGVLHMVSHNIAHRDLKSDNILLETTNVETPLAVITDFGCCLAEKSVDLSVPYTSFDIEKGGNAALMAPEIIRKKPGPFSKLNYSKSDLWAIGAIAYEVFGAQNPFYNSRLKNTTYKNEDLPDLPNAVPSIFNRLVKNLLRLNPSERLNPDIAANVCQLFLWAPNSWLDQNNKLPSYKEILEWLLNLAAKILVEGKGSRFYEGKKLTYVEYLLISTLLCRVKLESIKVSLQWIRDCNV